MKIYAVLAGLLIGSTAFAMEMNHHHHKDSPPMEMSAVPSEHVHAKTPAACSAMEVWDYNSAMCKPLPMKGMPMKMAMVHGNAFLVGITERGPRGRTQLASPNMVMADVGKSVGDNHYVDLELMATAEKWTFPKSGYPELLQIGEQNQEHVPFIDAQHPHSSPIMGLTLSDTIAFGHEKDHIKIFFAPRGAATDGPVAFMHRPTGMVNPDAPLGHHIGQDVGHITSTVLGASLRLGTSNIELSTFNGKEPEPTEVDLPMGTPNSYAGRFIHQFTPQVYAMASAAYIKNPEPHDPELDHVWRYSASLYHESELGDGWKMHDAWIYGLVNFYDDVSALSSVAQEFLFQKNKSKIWSRFEVLQRTPNELAIPGIADGDTGRWVTAATLGYTHQIGSYEGAEVGLGASGTADFLPESYESAYGKIPLTAKIFLNVNGMKMWDL